MKIYVQGILLFLLFLFLGLIILFSIHKGEEIVYLSNFHKYKFFRITISFITRLGEAITFIPTLIFLFVTSNRKKVIYLSIILILVFLLVPFIKSFFPEMNRPIHYLKTNNLSHLIPIWELHQNFSFPSGHTTAATTFFLSLYFLFPFKKYSILLVLIPFLVAFSRVFLFQHYLIDVIAGLILGFLFSFFSFTVYLYLDKRNNE